MTSHECGPWSFIQQYDVVPHMLWLNESDLQRIAVMFDEIWLETVIGAIRRTVVLNICQGRCCWSRDRDWKIRVATRERCSDAANQAIIRWSSLMAPSAHLRLTGEAASWLRLGVLPPVRGGHTQVQAVLQELTPLLTLVDWVDFRWKRPLRSIAPSSPSTPMHGGRSMYESTNPHDSSALMWDLSV
jgi:hypothetical protein